MRIYNTLTRKVENFEPINPPNVGMYTCGPTVYDFMHIGNLRTFVLSDTLLRTLKYNGYKVKAVENITDIDDKSINRAKERREDVSEVAKEFTKYFLEDVAKLNISIEDIVSPRATENISSMVQIIELLLKKEIAYKGNDGIYFAVDKFKDYGKLSGLDKRKLKKGARVQADQYDKENWSDFALWKFKKENEPGWPAPFGEGRPGWHIECSAMSMKYLGENFDIHCGGVDLLFPHHENEIAQSEAATGKSPFVRYWIHGAHLLVDGQKMSKSQNNFYTLKDIEGQGFNPLALRYLYLQTHYRQEMNFTWEALEAAQNALNKLRKEISSWGKPEIGCAEFEQKFADAINDDLNMPEALAVVWELLKSDYPTSAKAESLFKMDSVFGLDLEHSRKLKVESRKLEIPEQVKKLIEEREEYRKGKRYHLADQWRNKIRKLGFNIEDKEEGTVISGVDKN